MSLVRLAATLTLALFAASASLAAQSQDFDREELGALPDGWFVPIGGTDFTVVDDPAGGTHCAHLRRRAGDMPVRNAMRTFDATAQRGKLVTLRAKVRAGKGARVQLWLRVDRPDRQTGYFDNMQDRPVTAQAWQQVELVGTVAADAERIAFGALLMAGDELWLDDVQLTFEAAGEGSAPLPPAPLSPRGLDNVIAFARLVGYVRWFHPSDAAATLDWDAFTIDGMRTIETAADAAALAAALTARFANIAPTLTIVPTQGVADERRIEAPEGATQCVAWKHHGVGLSEPSIYRSRRTFASLDARGDLPDPAAPLRIDLPGGVTCRLPLAIHAHDDATLPPSTAPTLPRRPRLGSADRATRLAAVATAWNVFQHFYPYFDVVGGDWHATLRQALTSAATDADERAFLTTMQRLVAELRDGHGNVHLTTDTRYAAPPFAVGWIEDQLVVTAIGEALAGKIAVGDVITRLDGVAAAEVFASAKARHSGATEGWLRYRTENALLLGTEGSELQLELRCADGERRQLTVTRVTGPQPTRPRPEPASELERGIWYLDVDRLTDARLDAALPDLQKARAIVIDFRGYPRGMSPQKLFGHFVKERLKSARWCVPQVTLPDRADMGCRELGRWDLRPQQPHVGARLVFVTNGGAISYAESCLGIVEHYRLGEIVGERTAGTNGNVNPFSVPGNLSISWTGMQVLKHDGSVHHGVGIVPTVPCRPTVAGVRAGKDELLQKALEVARRDG